MLLNLIKLNFKRIGKKKLIKTHRLLECVLVDNFDLFLIFIHDETSECIMLDPIL